MLTACTIILGVVFVYGFVRGDGRDRITLRVLNEPRLLTVVVGLPDADDRYRFLSVYGCSAELTDSGTAYCTGFFERESTIEVGPQTQHLIAWRDLPGGTMQIQAMAFDDRQHVLAARTLTVFRGR